MNKEAFVTLASSDLATITGGDLLGPQTTADVLSVLGHTEQSVMDVVKRFGLTPGGTFANGAAKGAQNSSAVMRIISRPPWAR